MTWAYGPDYVGPYNPADQLNLQENVTAQNTYLTYDLTLLNKGKDRSGFVELPTFYFNNNFRRYYFADPATGAVSAHMVPVPTSMNNPFSVATHDESTGSHLKIQMERKMTSIPSHGSTMRAIRAILKCRAMQLPTTEA